MIFEELVCRDNTVYTLEKLQLGKYIDYVLCCDDKGFVPKPHPDNAWKICKDLRIDPTVISSNEIYNMTLKFRKR